MKKLLRTLLIFASLAWGSGLSSWSVIGGSNPMRQPANQTESGEEKQLGEDLTVHPLTSSIWLHISWTEIAQYGRVPANGILIVGRGESIMIDTPWNNQQTAQLCQWAARDLDAPVTVVIPTHSHADCMGGLEEAHRRGAFSYAAELTREFALRDGSDQPKAGFSKWMEVQIQGRKVILHYLGPGHTSDNIVVWIPDERILFGGCLVKSASARTLGFTGEADLTGWPRTIDLIRQKFPAVQLIVPGHGAPGGTELLDHTQGLLRTIVPSATD
jgi:metallo-beta-lactamase class B